MPYNHVMVNTTWSNEVDQVYDMQVVNLKEELQDDWHSSGLLQPQCFSSRLSDLIQSSDRSSRCRRRNSSHRHRSVTPQVAESPQRNL